MRIRRNFSSSGADKILFKQTFNVSTQSYTKRHAITGEMVEPILAKTKNDLEMARKRLTTETGIQRLILLLIKKFNKMTLMLALKCFVPFYLEYLSIRTKRKHQTCRGGNRIFLNIQDSNTIKNKIKPVGYSKQPHGRQGSKR